MSAKDRRIRAQRDDDTRFLNAVQNGLRLALMDSDGRAFIWWLYAVECRTEGQAELGQRAIGMALAHQAKSVDFDGWQLMREENERPKAAPAPKHEDAEGDEE